MEALAKGNNTLSEHAQTDMASVRQGSTSVGPQSIFQLIAQLYERAQKRKNEKQTRPQIKSQKRDHYNTEIGKYLSIKVTDYEFDEKVIKWFYDNYIRTYQAGGALKDKDFEQLSVDTGIKIPVGVHRLLSKEWCENTTSKTMTNSGVIQINEEHIFTGEDTTWGDYQNTMANIVSVWSDKTNTDPNEILDLVEGTKLPTSLQTQAIVIILRKSLKDSALNWLNTQVTRGFDMLSAFILEYGEVSVLHKVQFMEEVLTNLPTYDEIDKLVLYVKTTLMHEEQFNFTLADYLLIELVRKASGREFILDKILSMDKMSSDHLIEILEQLKRNRSYVTEGAEVFEFKSLGNSNMKVDTAAQVHARRHNVGMSNFQKVQSKLKGIAASISVDEIGELTVATLKLQGVHIAKKLQTSIFSVISAIFNGTIKGAYFARERSNLILPDNTKIPLAYKGMEGWFLENNSKPYKPRWNREQPDKQKHSEKSQQ